MDLRSTSKVELHRHLEGAIRLETVFDLSVQAGIPLPATTVEELAPYALIREPVDSLEEALSRFAIAQNCIRSYEAVRRIGHEAVEDLAADNVRMGELRFSPEFMCGPAGLDWDEAMRALSDGVGAAARTFGVVVGLVAIFSRDFGIESARRTVDFAIRNVDQLVGFDIAGSEVGYPPAMYAQVMAPLRETGLGLTTHYGESGGPEYPREAVEALRPSRLGHGLSVARDPSVVDLVLEHGVTLEMCPTSNVLTRGVARAEDHPARQLLGRGVRVTINSDDPGLMGIDLTHEWEVTRRALGFTEDDFAAATRNAIEACFLPGPEKARVVEQHFGWVSAGSAA